MATTDPLIQTSNSKEDPSAVMIAEFDFFSLKIAIVCDPISQIIFKQKQTKTKLLSRCSSPVTF